MREQQMILFYKRVMLEIEKRDNLISKLQADIEIKDKVIDYMAKEINKAYYDENHFYLFFEGNFDDKNLPKRINKIKQYFYGKVENNE